MMSISVVIPLYNKERNIVQTLHSVLEQTYQDFEIVLIDDGSTDNSLAEVTKFDDPRIRIISQPNAGVSAARNHGIVEAHYDIIAFLDADDVWLPEHLNQIIQLKNNFPECGVFATNYKIIDSIGAERAPVNTQIVLHDQDSGIIHNYFDSATRTAPPLWTSAIAVRKNAIEDIGGFPIGITLGEDLLTWARLACKYSIAYSKTITAIYHFQTFSELTTPGKSPDKIDYVGDELKKLINFCPLNPVALKRYLGLWHRMRLNEFMRRGERLSSLKEMKKILSYTICDHKSYVLFLLAMLPKSLKNRVLQARATYQTKKETM